MTPKASSTCENEDEGVQRGPSTKRALFSDQYSELEDDIIQTCQLLIKENLETHEKKSGDSIKDSEILFFFSRSRLNKPLFHRGKSSTVHLNILFVFPPPLFAMFIRLRSLSRTELTKTTGKLNKGDAWELDLVPRAYSPFIMADRH